MQTMKEMRNSYVVVDDIRAKNGTLICTSCGNDVCRDDGVVATVDGVQQPTKLGKPDTDDDSYVMDANKDAYLLSPTPPDAVRCAGCNRVFPVL